MSRKTKKKSKGRKPLTISIHGQDLAIEAKIADGRLAEVLAEAIKQASTKRAAAEPSPFMELIREFGKSLRKEQVELLMNSFDMSQKVFFMEIMNMATSAKTSTRGEQAAPQD